MKKGNEKKVTFDKLGRVDWEDEAAIEYDGELVGELLRYSEENLGSYGAKRVYAYEIQIDITDERIEKTFYVDGLHVIPGGFSRSFKTHSEYTTARAALAAAKQWARTTVRELAANIEASN